MQRLSSLQTFPKTPQLLFNSLDNGGNGPKLELELLLLEVSCNSSFSHEAPLTVLVRTMDFESSVVPTLRPPSEFSSALQAKARRFTGRSDLIIRSRRMAGKLNLGITLTSYDNVVGDDLQKIVAITMHINTEKGK